MPRIHQLSAHETHKIAAGEVVERPANVVKELIENALDAQATQITVHIEQAGKELIRVVDNGIGMDEEDAHHCFNHHATSKITSVDDLSSLTTFGFRGEALSSIAAVSLVTLITKEQQARQAIQLELEHGTVTSKKYISSSQGTDIAIRNLFYNVPARHKFLRSDETEWRQILSLFHAFCLDYINIQFSLYHNDTLIHHCPAASDVTTRIMQLWDASFASNMIPLNDEDNNISISGVISHQHYARYDRSMIFLFVNKRWVKNQHLSRALLKGYLNVLPQNKLPAACIFIDLPSSEVDINVHPRKEEVQFLHPRRCEALLQAAVKKSLEQHLSQQLKTVKSSSISFDFDAPVFNDYVPVMPTQIVQPIGHHSNHEQQSLPQEIVHQQQIMPVTETFSHRTVIGIYRKTYILLEHEDGMYIVDQHAAHERIMYERFKHRFNNQENIQMLFPEIVSLSTSDMRILQPCFDFLNSIGIGIEQFGEQECVIKSCPIETNNIKFQELVAELIGWIKEHKHIDTQAMHSLIHEKLHAQMACKAAVKAGDELTPLQVEQLLADLQQCNNRFTCPHGRPTGWLLPLYDIEKQFKRKK